ncbi:hypothetical protein N7462_002264 [Penicillium macrosclerotiorum]|uniref:uncharacterized protein n=1 Tax=Penicillium macrosclerotiorum TaxID=303699 RepID=UPI0025477ADE|nr:uncharacterized protein N7462_002264 [Penicillium macrosclerotiorum]KAJ5692841.1 hypothetical protein N7462_002264 [Penicillium macrosclerotiorum]
MVGAKHADSRLGKVTAQTTSDFLWVDSNEPDRTAFKTRLAFVRARTHRRKKEAQLQELKAWVRPWSHDNRSGINPGATETTRVACPPLSHGPRMGVVDGVLNLPLNTDQDLNLYFDHFEAHCSKSYLPLSHQHTIWFIRLALSQPALLKIILSISAFHRSVGLSIRDANPGTIQATTRDGLQLRGEAIKSLRQALENPVHVPSEAILLVVMHLVFVEGAEGNLEAAEAHMDGVRRIIEVLGGFESLAYPLMTLVHCCEFIKSAIGAPIIFSISPKWARKLFRESAFLQDKTYCTDSPMGTRFFTSPWSSTLNPTLISVLHALRRIIIFQTRQAQLPPTAAGPSEINYLVLVVHQLHSLGHAAVLPPFEEIVRHAVHMQILIQLWTLYGMPVADISASILRRSLIRNFAAVKADPKLLFWVLFIGALTAREPSCAAWFRIQLGRARHMLDLQSWPDALAVLCGFFYVSLPLGDPGKFLWMQLQQDGRG